MKDLFIGRTLTDAFMKSLSYFDSYGDISKACDEAIESVAVEEWDTEPVTDVPFFDIGIPRTEVLMLYGLCEKDFDELQEDSGFQIDDDLVLEYPEDIDGGHSFVTVRLFYNQDGIIRKAQYIGHDHDDIGCDELLSELPTLDHLTVLQEILQDMENKMFLV